MKSFFFSIENIKQGVFLDTKNLLPVVIYKTQKIFKIWNSFFSIEPLNLKKMITFDIVNKFIE
jgi:hypothetical protein